MNYKILFLLIAFTYCQSVKAQKSGFYYKYEFDNYLLSKTQNADEYEQRLQETVKYHAIARENNVEGRLDFLLINNGDQNSEIILDKHGLSTNQKGVNLHCLPYPLLEQEVKEAFKNVDHELLRDNSEKFITKFTILFKMEDSVTFSDDDNVDFVIVGKRVIKTTTHSSH